MDISEITTKTALVKSRIPGVSYVINPYLGCGHGCSYCYAVFMRKYSRFHQNAPWGRFVEVKTNIALVLRTELARKKAAARAMLSSVCDPYQPVEARYTLTRQCIQALKDAGWGIDILTRSPLVERDIDILSSAKDVSVGFSIPTDRDEVRAVLEPQSPAIESRIEALKKLHEAGISTWVFVAPVLPMNPVRLCELIAPYVESVMVDQLNYKSQVTRIFKQHGWEHELTDGYGIAAARQIESYFGSRASIV